MTPTWRLLAAGVNGLENRGLRDGTVRRGLQDFPLALRSRRARRRRPSPSLRERDLAAAQADPAFVGTTSLILSFQVFDVVRVMTQGGPVRSTTVFVYAIYEQVFINLRVGRASAEVVVFFVVLLLLTALQLWAWRGKPRGARA